MPVSPEATRGHDEQRADLVVVGQRGRRCWRRGSAGGGRRSGRRTCRIDPPSAAGGLVGPAQQLDLGALGDRLGQDRRPRSGGARRGGSARPRVTPAAAATGRRRPRPRPRRRRPVSDRSAVWAKPVVSPTTTRMPAPRSRPEESSSTWPSSSRADDDRLSSTKTSAKSPPVRRAVASVRWMVASSSTSDLRRLAGDGTMWRVLDQPTGRRTRSRAGREPFRPPEAWLRTVPGCPCNPAWPPA